MIGDVRRGLQDWWGKYCGKKVGIEGGDVQAPALCLCHMDGLVKESRIVNIDSSVIRCLQAQWCGEVCSNKSVDVSEY